MFTDIPLQTQGFRSASLAWGDFDGDGHFDLLAGGYTASSHELQLYRQENGTLVPGPFAALSGFTGATAWADFDGDGDLDFAAGGFSHFSHDASQSLNARLFRNDGPAGFTAMGTEILMSGVPIWSDFDRDGDLDLLIAGAADEPASGDLDLRRLRIYVNEPGRPWRVGWDWVLEANARLPLVEDWNHDGWPDIVYPRMRFDDTMALVFLRNRTGLQFEATESEYSGPAWPHFTDWGDFDNDGDLDAVFTGLIQASHVLRFMRNDGTHRVPIDLPGAGGLGIASADIDNDGWLDFVTSDGPESDLSSFIRLHHNEGPGPDPAFSTEDLTLPGAGFSTLAWADFDRDGDGDLLISGFTNWTPSLRLLRNPTSVSNPPPSLPANLKAQVGVEGAVELTWNPATDPNQSGGLTYNVRVGRTSQVDVMPPHADPTTGRLLIPQRGNAGSQRRSVLTNLLAGTYHWSVQAVDHGFASSAFAPDGQFTIASGRPRTSDLSVSDIRYQHATFSGSVIPNGSDTVAWFEYGPSPDLISRTEPGPMGSGIELAGITNTVSGLLTAMTYQFQLVASNANGIARSPEATFLILNTPPTLAVISRITNAVGQAPTPITVTVSDLESPVESLVASAVGTQPGTGQNTNLLSAAGILLTGQGAERTLTLIPTPQERGEYRILLTVTDEMGAQATRSVILHVVDFMLTSRPPANPGTDLAWIDVDRDGWLDLVGASRWLHNQGGTHFLNPGRDHWEPLIGIIAPADANGDGVVDFAVTGTRSGARMTQVFTYQAMGAPSNLRFRGLQDPLTPGFTDAALSWADFDADGDVDLFACGSTNFQPQTAFGTQVWRNDGALHFTPVPDILPRLTLASMAWADFDRDGDLDLCLLGSTNRTIAGAYTRILRNDGAGVLTEIDIALPQFSQGFADWGDFNADGLLDLVVSGYRLVGGRSTNEVLVLRQETDGSFSRFASLEPFPTTRGVWIDFDNDGDLDMAYTGTDSPFPDSVFKLYLNEGGMNFRDISPAHGLVSAPFAFGDFDGDGDLDIANLSSLIRNMTLRTNTAPEAPSALTSSVNGNGVTFLWDAAKDANQLRIHPFLPLADRISTESSTLLISRRPARSIVSLLANTNLAIPWS